MEELNLHCFLKWSRNISALMVQVVIRPLLFLLWNHLHPLGQGVLTFSACLHGCPLPAHLSLDCAVISWHLTCLRLNPSFTAPHPTAFHTRVISTYLCTLDPQANSQPLSSICVWHHCSAVQGGQLLSYLSPSSPSAPLCHLRPRPLHTACISYTVACPSVFILFPLACRLSCWYCASPSGLPSVPISGLTFLLCVWDSSHPFDHSATLLLFCKAIDSKPFRVLACP